MGLDITAYSKLKAVGVHERPADDDAWEREYETHIHAFAYKGFEASFRGLPILGDDPGFGQPGEFIDGGCYEKTLETETFGFHAGSYSGYGWRREFLAQLFNPHRDPKLPFYELIHFADNEGTIGPEAAADLLADFREHAEAYRAATIDYHHEYGFYTNFTRACELAADGGLIDFH